MRRVTITLAIAVLCVKGLYGQKEENGNSHVYDLENYINAALELSNDVKNAKSSFLSSYWDYRSFKASFLPSLNLSGTIPKYVNTISPVQQNDGSVKYTPQNYFNETMTLSINQKVGLTGGNFSIESNLERNDDFEALVQKTYKAQPIGITYQQNLFGVNWLKWQRRIDPLKYEEAKRNYLYKRETVILSAISKFFDLVIAQQDLRIAKVNLRNADTLYKISKGRFKLGSISESDVMQMELSKLNAESAYSQRLVDLEDAQNKFRSFLGISDKRELALVVPTKVPEMVLSYEKVLEHARKNNPDIVSFNRQLLEAERWLEENRRETGFTANLRASIGFNQNSIDLQGAYANVKPSQTAQVTISMPIIDWGQRRGKIKMAQSNLDLVKGKTEQSQIEFDQNIFVKVMRFNMMGQKYRIAAKSDTIAQIRYKVSMDRFIAGKISVLDLNTALSEKDNANSNFVNTLENFWWYYYDLRRVSLYDFEKGRELEADYESLIR
ncbi:TolC family protein [uncultured Acetobacteroides sp.]|uniref:TolC family protein n=1 Tax=uncultured Acetobacteroides sp. TaxID=1760811 RepID=UPI0029F5C01F|nr:TolC family protein [uncultured Acetobacteroides sp.]